MRQLSLITLCRQGTARTLIKKLEVVMKEPTNVLLAYGYSQEQIDERLALIWHEIFEGPNKFYFEVDSDSAYIVDTGNGDVRTEGMSYGMLLAIQYNRKDVFDRLWNWTMTNMFMKTGRHANYFAWSVHPNGIKNSDGPAPDGEEFFALALFFARNRWGDGEGIYQYSQHARNLLSYCIHKGGRYEGLPMWNIENKLIKFVPEVEFSDPSYHVPHFYEQFALYANEEDRLFWKEAAQASRAYLKKALHEETGLNAEYADYQGHPCEESGHGYFFSDAYRTALNVAVDSQWYGRDAVLCQRLEKLQAFFATTAKGNEYTIYTIEGKSVEEPILHPVGLLATNAAASAAIMDAPFARKFVAQFWETPLRTGERRYYDNFLYAFSFLVLSGNYNIY